MLEQRIKIGEGGRLVIPALYRKELNVQPGDELIIRLDDGELRLFNQQHALQRIRQAVHKKSKTTATEDFLAFRKRDSGIE